MAISNRNQLRTGIVGAVVTAICCFTPALVVAFGILGVSAWLGWIDWVLFPALAAFLALTAFALARRGGPQTGTGTGTGAGGPEAG